MELPFHINWVRATSNWAEKDGNHVDALVKKFMQNAFEIQDKNLIATKKDYYTWTDWVSVSDCAHLY